MSKLYLWSMALCLGAGTLLSNSATAQPGAVDPRFNAGRGAIHLNVGHGRSVLMQPDGKMLVAGEFNAVNVDFAPAIVRLNPDGSLDNSFNANASSLGTPGSYYWEHGPKVLALQPNGQILVGGWLIDAEGNDRYLARVNSDGSLDTSFNPDISNGIYPVANLQASVLSGGKILVDGRFTSVNGVPRNNLVRLNADGTLDTTFYAAVDANYFVTQSTGKVVVSSGDRVLRLNTNGTLDNTFGTVIAPTGYNAGKMLLAPDDKVIWTAIWTGIVFDWPPTIISRLNADGTADWGFTPFHSYSGNPLLFQEDSKLIIYSIPYDGEEYTWRLNPDGSPDPSFHPAMLGAFAQQADGRLIVVGQIFVKPYGIRRLFLDGSNDDSFTPGLGLVFVEPRTIDEVCLLPNGKIVIAGEFNYVHSVDRLKIAVLDHNGAVDLSFDARDLLGPPQYYSPFTAMAAQSDGKILVAFQWDLVRLKATGEIDSTFHYNPNSTCCIEKLLVQSDGKILVSDSPENLVRLNPDGSVDSTFNTDQTGEFEFIQADTKILARTPHALARFNADGSIDPTFDSNATGQLFGPGLVAAQPDGRFLIWRHQNGIMRIDRNGAIDESFHPAIIQVDYAQADRTGIYFPTNLAPSGQPSQFEAVRLFADGSRDPNFSVSFNPGATVKRLLIEPDGQILVAGLFDQVNGIPRTGIARLNGAVPKKLANISTRVGVGDLQSVEIGGFIITGTAPKQVIVRAIGPSLIHNGLPGAGLLANPFLELHDSTGAIIAQNDNWRDTQEAEIIASGIPPTEDAESAIVSTCAPGNYTAVVQGRDGGDGIALVEVYDLDPAADSSLANISTRGFVNTDEGVMIAGFILRGPGASTIIMRALGPSLAASGINAALADPTLSVYDQSGSLIAFNDEWRMTQEAELEAYGMGPANDHEAALITIPSPGSYTAIVNGANNQSGVGLVEIYHVE